MLSVLAYIYSQYLLIFPEMSVGIHKEVLLSFILTVGFFEGIS